MDKAKYFRIISRPTFLDKFIEKEFIRAGYAAAATDEENAAAVTVFVSSPTCPDPPAGDNTLVVVRPEGAFGSSGNDNPSATTILTPYIIGTGMEGLMRDIVAMTARGTMIHITGNEARVSVIHATDVARIAVLLAGTPGRYIISDGFNPTWHDLIEALSMRVGHPRIPTLSPSMTKWYALGGKLWGGPDKKMISTITADATVAPTPLPVSITPVNTTEFLKSHEYTDEDL